MLYIILIMLLPALLGIGWGLTELIRRTGFKGLKMELEFHQPQELNESSQVPPYANDREYSIPFAEPE